ncbi:MAG: integrase [Stappia sp.]|uniref:tyrosine-type recombinase/integrase n=1 Tax=Stappia sp. TaxID=1870903 RepID=UPI000C5482EC|nr:site-specific integrase [Stappia sp.]MAB00149.1 integrase [Stappia sp.]MBM20788.1 integrase [Stappia sp.]
MSVYRPRSRDPQSGEWVYKSKVWHYDFILTVAGQRRRFHGSTGETAKRKAEEFERKERERVRAEGPNDHLTLAAACLRYNDEVAFGQASEADTLIALEHCCRLIGGDRRLVSITADDIAIAVRRRAGETKGRKNPKLISPATVNRQIVEPMRRLLRRARRIWQVRVDADAIDWTGLKLREPQERAREMTGDEADRFWAALRQDYLPIVWFLANRGLRVNSVINMTVGDLDLDARRIRIWRKGHGLVWVPINDTQAAVIATELQRAPRGCKAVWTYQRARGKKRGKRSPITYAGLRRTISTTLRAAKITDFRIHDLRHDFASKLLRATRDLKLVQDTLLHSDISTTIRYTHVMDEDVRAGLDAMPSRNYPGIPATSGGRKTKSA